MSEKVLRCAIYIRVSTEEQHLNGLSLPAQKEVLVDYANRNNYVIVDVYADEGVSARKPMSKRKELTRLLNDVKENKIDMILVTKLDRWFRNIKDYNITEEILQAHNCYWKTIFENYDSSTANGQMVINIMLSVNQAECDRTSERIKAVLDYKRSIGEVTSGMCAPYGYKIVNNRIIKDDAVSDIVKDAFQYYFKCFSIRKVDRYIHDKYGERYPSWNKIDRLFKNEKYAGKWKGNPNYCEPYITCEQYKIIREVSQSKTKPNSNHTYIFSSLILCPVCGRKFSGRTKKHRLKDGNISERYAYTCIRKYKAHSSAFISEKNDENFMIENIFDALQKEYMNLTLKQQKELSSSVNVNRLEDELDRLNKMYQKGRISEEFYDVEYERLQSEISKCTSSVSADVLSRYSELLNTFSGNWLEMYLTFNDEHKQAFWKSTIKEIYVDKNTHKLCGFKFLV